MSLKSQDVVDRFREYLRIASVHPDVDYGECVDFLKGEAALLELPVEVVEVAPKKPVVIITWVGLQPSLPSIMLNSHMDVVPVYEEFWTHPPFEACIEDGFIYGRGSQDMKSVGMMHLEAVRRLKVAGIRLKRTVHVTFVPDEEINSDYGMKLFAVCDEFKKLNVGFEFDESIPNLQPDTITVHYGERITTSLSVTCTCTPSHGSLLPSDTAGEKIIQIINRFMVLRAEEKKKLDSGTPLGEVISINLTKMAGGLQVNIIPGELTATFDVRLPPHIDLRDFDNMLRSWCEEVGDGCSFKYITKNDQIKNTSLEDNPFWDAISEVLKNMNISTQLTICPGATDARFVRQRGIPALNLSPIMSTPILAHAHDENIHVDVFLKGIRVFENILQGVGNV